MTEKICTGCKISKSIEDFTFHTKSNGYREPKCRVCRSILNTQWYRDNPRTPERRKNNAISTQKRQRAKHKYVEDSKRGKPCVDCGKVYALCAMEYDHVIGKKLFGLGYGVFHSYEAIDIEIAKCAIRCANCHRIKTHGCQ